MFTFSTKFFFFPFQVKRRKNFNVENNKNNNNNINNRELKKELRKKRSSIQMDGMTLPNMATMPSLPNDASNNTMSTSTLNATRRRTGENNTNNINNNASTMTTTGEREYDSNNRILNSEDVNTVVLRKSKFKGILCIIRLFIRSFV